MSKEPTINKNNVKKVTESNVICEEWSITAVVFAFCLTRLCLI